MIARFARVALHDSMCSNIEASSVAALVLRSCVNLFCQVWQCEVSACFNGEQSMRMKPMLLMPSSEAMSCWSSLYRVMSVSKLPIALFAFAYRRIKASLSTSQMCL